MDMNDGLWVDEHNNLHLTYNGLDQIIAYWDMDEKIIMIETNRHFHELRK